MQVGVIAVDGSKFAAMAADKATRTYEQIAAEILAEAGRIDAAEDEIHGPARGDELPEHLAHREGRRAWLREAKQRLDAERAEREESIPKAREKRLELCRRRLVEEWRTAPGQPRLRGLSRARDPRARQAGDGLTAQAGRAGARSRRQEHTSDPDACRMKGGRAFIPAYNTQAVTTEGQIIVAAEITTEGVDFEQLEPMISTAERGTSTPGFEIHRLDGSLVHTWRTVGSDTDLHDFQLLAVRPPASAQSSRRAAPSPCRPSVLCGRCPQHARADRFGPLGATHLPGPRSGNHGDLRDSSCPAAIEPRRRRLISSPPDTRAVSS